MQEKSIISGILDKPCCMKPKRSMKIDSRTGAGHTHCVNRVLVGYARRHNAPHLRACGHVERIGYTQPGVHGLENICNADMDVRI